MKTTTTPSLSLVLNILVQEEGGSGGIVLVKSDKEDSFKFSREEALGSEMICFEVWPV